MQMAMSTSGQSGMEPERTLKAVIFLEMWFLAKSSSIQEVGKGTKNMMKWDLQLFLTQIVNILKEFS